MTKRKRDYKVASPTLDQKDKLRPWELAAPWSVILGLREGWEEAQAKAEEARAQLFKARKEQFLNFFADQGINNSSDSHKSAATWEVGGAKVLALPDGWKWEHGIEHGRPYLGIYVPRPFDFNGSISRLRLKTPEGLTLHEITSMQKKVQKQEPFRRREMLMASQRVLKGLLPQPRAEQPAPVGTFDGGDQ